MINVILLAFYISLQTSFGLIHNRIFIVPEHPRKFVLRNQIINTQKYEQEEALFWFKHILRYSNYYPHLISNETHKSRFFDYLYVGETTPTIFQKSPPTMYKLFHIPSRNLSKLPQTDNNNNNIVISIIYPTHDIDHREGKFYIGQVLRHLLKNSHHRIIITLCEDNNNNNDEDIVLSDIELLRQLVPVFIINSNITNNVSNFYEREKQAYLQCISANFQSFPQSNYILLLQDDAEPVNLDFSTRLLALIDNRLKQQWPVKTRQQPAFLKLYHPRWLISYWYPSVYTIVQLFATSFLLTFFLVLCLRQPSILIQYDNNKKLWKKQHGKTWNDRQSLSNTRLFYFVFYFILITFTLTLLDHSHVSWIWRSLHPSFYAIYPAPSCCIPAVLYFRQTYPQVIDYLTRTKCRPGYAIDSAFDDLPKNTSLETFLVEPNLVHHIGLFSRLRHNYINPYLLD